MTTDETKTDSAPTAEREPDEGAPDGGAPSQLPDQSPDDETAGDDDGAATSDGGEDPEPDEDEPEDPFESEPENRATPRDEKEAEKLWQRVTAEDERHAKRVTDLFGDEAVHLLRCPMCMHVTAGWLFPPNVMPLPDESLALVRGLLGMPDVSTFADSTTTETCPDCGGLGRVKSGSHVPGYDVIDCQRCVSKGWVSKQGASSFQITNGSTGTTPPPVPVSSAEADEDPQVRSLRERGFLVVPPTNAGAGV